MLETYMHYISVSSIVITLIEKNPGPMPSSCDKFPICHWNGYSILVHNSEMDYRALWCIFKPKLKKIKKYT